MPRRNPVSWISFDVDYLGGSFGCNEKFYKCVKNCDHCVGSEPGGRPKTQILPDREAKINTLETIELMNNFDIRKAYMRQSHASIVDLLIAGDNVYNIDAHHDHYSNAYTKKDVHCGNWVSWAMKHHINVWSPCCPVEVDSYLKDDNRDVYLYISLSPNYASNLTDKYLIEILLKIPCKIDTNLTK